MIKTKNGTTKIKGYGDELYKDLVMIMRNFKKIGVDKKAIYQLANIAYKETDEQVVNSFNEMIF